MELVLMGGCYWVLVGGETEVGVNGGGGCYWVLVGGEAGVGVNGGLLLGLSGRRGWS